MPIAAEVAAVVVVAATLEHALGSALVPNIIGAGRPRTCHTQIVYHPSLCLDRYM